ncbi:nickel-binding protein [Marinoscillum sp.]|uniref:nickel-binding protein n=1 Tax=Marinoscillum sp. TaxID=2024838 RepID=UPI003BAC91CA
MDLHMVPDAELDDVVEAHKMDVAVQDQYGCNCMTFWYDQFRGNAFCLIEAPDKEAVIEMHNEAHGLVPHKIMEVNSNLVAAFLGRIQDPKSLEGMSKTDIKAFYSDPAFRVLLVTVSMDFKLLAYKEGNARAYELFSLQNEIVQEQIKSHEGQEIEMENNGFVASFITTKQAVQCAQAIQKQLHIAADILEFRAGLHAGIPVTNSEELFGEAIRYARHLCLFSRQRQMIISDKVNQLYREDESILSNKKVKIITPEEESFLEKLFESLVEHWNNPEFDVNQLASHLFVSSSQLYRKTKGATGQSPNELLREYRLFKSQQLLNKTDGNISQVAFDAGFSSPSYFTRCFQKRFGIKPLGYVKQKGKND